MKKNRIIFYISFVFVIYIAAMLYIYHINHCIIFNSDFGNYLSGVFAPISAIGTIAVSYLIFKLTSIEKRADDDFKVIMAIYFKIEESFELLKRQNIKNEFLDDHDSFYERQIKVDCMLLLNYIRRYPHKYSTKRLEFILYGIYANPNYESDYIKLATEFQNFCFELNPDLNPSNHKID